MIPAEPEMSAETIVALAIMAEVTVPVSAWVTAVPVTELGAMPVMFEATADNAGVCAFQLAGSKVAPEVPAAIRR